MATKLTGKQLTKVTKKDLANAVDDGNGVLYSPDGKRLIKLINKDLEHYAIKEGTEVIADEAFIPQKGMGDRKKKLKEIVIPNTVTHIGKGAFVGCMVEKFVLPDSVTYLGEMAFQGCESLEEIIMPDTLTHIGGMAFFGCISLKHIVIPRKTKHLGCAAFCGCHNVEIGSHSSRFVVQDGFLVDNKEKEPLHYFGKGKVVTLPEGMVRLDWSVFAGSDVEEITVPDTVTTLGFRAFNDCPALRKVTLPASIKSIEGLTFTLCKSLKEICVPKGCKEAFQKMFKEAVYQANTNDNCMFSYRVLNNLNPEKFSNPKDYLTTLLPVKYWELVVEI